MTLTQILQKIKSAFYTKSETDTKLNTKANDNNVVHKSGTETIDGLKTFNYWQIINMGLNVKWITGNKEQKSLHLFATMNDKYEGYGASLQLHSEDLNGGFRLIAKNKNATNMKIFAGTSDGVLTWDNNEILTRANGVTLDTAQTISGNKTFTGQTTFIGHNLLGKNPTIDLLHSTDSSWVGAGITGADKNNVRVGFIDWWTGKDGGCEFRIFCRDRKDNEKEVLLAGIKDGVTHVVTGGKNMVRSINGYVADTAGNIAYNIGNDLVTVNADTAIGSIRLFVYRGSSSLIGMDVTSGGNLSLISIAISAYNESQVAQYDMFSIVSHSTIPGTWKNIGPAVSYGCSSLFIRVA